MTTVSPFFTWRRAMTDSALPSTTKLVLFIVAEYTNAMDDICWPSLDTIADKATLSIRAVTKHLAIAEESGWLTRWRSRRPGRRWAHAHYRLSIPDTVAVRQRDAIDFDLAANSGADEFSANQEPRSGNAEKTGNSEPRASNHGGEAEPRASAADSVAGNGPADESSWHHVPTSKPDNRVSNKTSLYQPTVVNGVTGGQREKPDEVSISCARWMFERVRARDAGLAMPDLTAWASDIDAMLVVDGHTLEAIAKLFGYADRDKFWAKVIISPARLRKNWDELRRRRNDAIAASNARKATQQTSSAAADRVCAHVENGCRCVHAASTIIGAGSSQRGYCRQHIGQYED